MKRVFSASPHLIECMNLESKGWYQVVFRLENLYHFLMSTRKHASKKHTYLSLTQVPLKGAYQVFPKACTTVATRLSFVTGSLYQTFSLGL